ncbi:toll/interleukin-1 receptor domain-containing protein [Massilia aurea]|uniref:toll/interleukin-1 receptor domain-containing protein n=1 Tax=Massilia aurea TaxID=373040 RepID=UPI0021617AEA|nr:toll/interleukin-1 receptor domain-containing protein [Massilia aurea]MCS0706549.1 toll/interleukin-1 receptor domain-containing protein [Massilia aurea]
MKRVLTVGLKYTGSQIEGVEFENFGLCRPTIDPDRAAFPLYEYDVIVINPESYSHFLFGTAGEFSGSPNELSDLKRKNDQYDLDTAYDSADRENELVAAIESGTTIVWCLSQPKRMNFFGYRETSYGYAAPVVASLVKRGDLKVKKGRRIRMVDLESPFARYFDSLTKTGWSLCLADNEHEGYSSIALTPEGYSLGGKLVAGSTVGWILTPPSSEDSTNRLILDALELEKGPLHQEKYHGIFLSHTSADKPFVRQLRKDLLERGVPKAWLDEAEIEIGDSLIAKIEEGMKQTRYIGVVLSAKSVNAPWVKKELEIAMNREIASGEVVVLPLVYEKCPLPGFLEGKLYGDFSDPDEYENVLEKLLRRLRIK